MTNTDQDATVTITDQAEPTAYPMTSNLLTSGEAGSYRYRVEILRVASPSVLEIGLVPVAEHLPFRPGQYALLGAQEPGIPERAYSMANAPRPDGRVRLLVTRYDEGITSGWIHDKLARGDEVTLSGPHGTLIADPTLDGPVLLLAAGCGVAPVSAVAEALLTQEPSRQITLLFSARTPAHVLQRARFEDLQRRHEQFRYDFTLTRDRTSRWYRRVPHMLGRLIDDLSGWEVFIAGNENFVRASRDEVHRLGAAASSVHTEEFLADAVWPGVASCND